MKCVKGGKTGGKQRFPDLDEPVSDVSMFDIFIGRCGGTDPRHIFIVCKFTLGLVS